MHQAPEFLAIGHISIDRRPDGSLVPGGTALYAALLASRFGLRSAILTRGRFDHIEDESVRESLTRYASEVDLIVQEADEPTQFTNKSVAGRREQTIHSWAGEIDLNGVPPMWRSAGIIHLGPIAQEIDVRRAGRLSPDFFGITPQGLMRDWRTEHDGKVTVVPLRLAYEFLGRIDGMVLSSEEHSLARDEIEVIGSRGLVAVTRGAAGVQLTDRGHQTQIPAFNVPVVDDTGSGDVFAAALFILRTQGVGVAQAARIASASAAVMIQTGGPDAVPTREQVDAFLADEQRKAQQRNAW
ncbi:MAG: carbohydrate kinase [Sphaerobacteraceae bacterium]|nr:MAG: carbohydrate kinase [Sphaerobacteraceae bacterium]